MKRKKWVARGTKHQWELCREVTLEEVIGALKKMKYRGSRMVEVMIGLFSAIGCVMSVATPKNLIVLPLYKDGDEADLSNC